MRTTKAAISTDGVYRYTLLRRWDRELPRMVFVMLNPSTADANLDDPTIRRCVGFAKREGCGEVMVVNLYAFRATNPKDLLTCADPVGPDNDTYLGGILRHAGAYDEMCTVVAAWGVHGDAERVDAVRALAPGTRLLSLGTTKDGHPRHPLYVKGDQPLTPWPAPAEVA